MLLLKGIMFKAFFHDFSNFNISEYQILICHFEHIFPQKSHFSFIFRIFGHICRYKCHIIYVYTCTWVFIWHHMPKIVDQSEISATPRASKIAKKNKTYINFLSAFAILEARGVAEISDRSTIFGLWCHMSIHVQLYAYMTPISKYMTKISKNEGKMRFFEQKCAQNDISKFFIPICLIIKNHEKML